MYQFLQDHAQPQYEGAIGTRDNEVGWGLPFLPSPETIDIERYTQMDKYKDDADIHPVHKADVYRARDLGLMIGTGDKFNPVSPLTREQAASIMVRLYDIIREEK